MISSQIVPWSYRKIGSRRLISIGLLCAAILFVLLSFVTNETNPWLIRLLLFGIGFFLGHSVGAVQFSAFQHIQSSSIGRATTIFHVQNRLGSAIGVAILASMLALESYIAGEMVVGQINITAYQIALCTMTGFLFIALLFALRIRDESVSKKGEQTSIQ